MVTGIHSLQNNQIGKRRKRLALLKFSVMRIAQEAEL